MIMLDNILAGNLVSEGGEIKANGCDEESHPLLAAPPPAASSSPLYQDLLNDLTYSDDDEVDEYWDALELGASTSSSPDTDTAQLLDDIQNSIFHMSTQQQQQQQQQQQSHLVHPFARGGSSRSSDGDEGSYLAYSITSAEEAASEDVDARLSAALANNSAAAKNNNNTDYGSMDAYFGPSGAAAVMFRPPSSPFDRSLGPGDGRLPQQREYSRRDSPPKVPSPKPKPGRMGGYSQPPQLSIQAITINSRQQRPNKNKNKLDTPPPVRPIALIAESPVTVAWSTDDAGRPLVDAEGDSDRREATRREERYEMPGGREEEWKRGRTSKLPGAEAGKRSRRHRRLKRIKKAAEAREAAVRRVRGTEQRPEGCNDVLFAFVFLCQFLVVSIGALAFGPGALRDKIYAMAGNEVGDEKGGMMMEDYNPFAGLQTDDIIIMSPLKRAMSGGASRGGENTVAEDPDFGGSIGQISHIDYINVIQLVCIASGYASLCSLLALGFVMMLSKNLLHTTLVFMVMISLTWTILGWAFSSSYILPDTGIAALVISASYAVVMWDRVPFASTNLSVALRGMRSTLDVPFVGACVLAVTFLWTIWWICAFVGTFDFLNDDEKLNDWMTAVVAFFLFSYYWTFQVIKGISQTTVASIIGKWWDMSEEDALPLCSSVLQGSITHVIVRSFGSICLGSLIVGPCVLVSRISTFFHLSKPKLVRMTKLPKRQPDGERADGGVVSRNINRWSYTYIGLYGYNFRESGSKAWQLFEARGWTHVISDDLIMMAVFMSSMIVGGTTACLGLIVEEMDGYSFTSLNKPIATAFLICLFLGLFLSSAFLSIIEGSVNAILVCYASKPVEFHANHHKLSEEMKDTWKDLWLQKPVATTNIFG